MKVIAVWYSRTGTTGTLVRWATAWLRDRGHRVSDARLRPRWELPYPLWLALSFVPGSRVPLADPVPADLTSYGACLLALPKWTFSCPPVNTFLTRAGGALPPTAVLLSCGGWDQDRYLRALETRLERLGVGVRGGLAVKRKHVGASPPPEFLAFLERAFPREPVPQGPSGQPPSRPELDPAP